LAFDSEGFDLVGFDTGVRSMGFKIVYDLDNANVGKGDVKVFDTNNSSDESDWQRVFDYMNHEFVGDCVVENGLIRLWIDEGQYTGLKLYYWNGNAWVLGKDRVKLTLTSSGKEVTYPFLKSITYTLESVTIKVRIEDTSTQDSDYYVDLEITLKRGQYFITISFNEINPLENITFQYEDNDMRFGFIGDDLVGDDDLDISANNTTMSDNFTVGFDNTGGGYLAIMGSSKKPSSYFRTYQGRNIYIYYITTSNYQNFKVYLGLTPFTQISNLFKEAEDATLGGGATVDTTQTDDSGDSVLLDAQNEYVKYIVTSITDLPRGRYIAFVRAKDTNQISNDLRMWIYNATDGRYLHEENDVIRFTLAGTFDYYGTIFDITDDEQGDTIDIYCGKDTSTANSIYVDYFLIIPITNGESWPQDLAHNALRTFTKRRKVYER